MREQAKWPAGPVRRPDIAPAIVRGSNRGEEATKPTRTTIITKKVTITTMGVRQPVHTVSSQDTLSHAALKSGSKGE